MASTIPTMRQKKAAKIYAEKTLKGETASKASILKEAGYSRAVQKTPERAMDTDGFQQALAEYLPDEYLLQQNQRLIEQTAHTPSSVKALELAYKISGRLSETSGGTFGGFLQQVNVSGNAEIKTGNKPNPSP